MKLWHVMHKNRNFLISFFGAILKRTTKIFLDFKKNIFTFFVIRFREIPIHILLNISTHKMWFFYVQKVLLFPLLIWRIQTLYVTLDSQCPRDYWPLVHTCVTNNLCSLPTQHFLKTVANCTTSQVSFYSVPFWVSLWLKFDVCHVYVSVLIYYTGC